MTIAVDWDIKHQTKQTKEHRETDTHIKTMSQFFKSKATSSLFLSVCLTLSVDATMTNDDVIYMTFNEKMYMPHM